MLRYILGDREALQVSPAHSSICWKCVNCRGLYELHCTALHCPKMHCTATKKLVPMQFDALLFTALHCIVLFNFN